MKGNELAEKGEVASPPTPQGGVVSLFFSHQSIKGGKKSRPIQTSDVRRPTLETRMR